jgi:hypothetical protein
MMGLRFRRSIKLLPGVRLNLSKSGVSTSVGVRGAHVTLGHGKVRETVGIPGTGLSYTETQSTHARHEQLEQAGATPAAGVLATLGNLIVLAILLAAVLVLAYSCGTLLR